MYKYLAINYIFISNTSTSKPTLFSVHVSGFHLRLTIKLSKVGYCKWQILVILRFC